MVGSEWNDIDLSSTTSTITTAAATTTTTIAVVLNEWIAHRWKAIINYTLSNVPRSRTQTKNNRKNTHTYRIYVRIIFTDGLQKSICKRLKVIST